MKINSNTQNIQYNNKISKVSFKSGLTQSIANQIRDCDVVDISTKLAKKDVDSEFHGNKIIAWCTNKVFDIYEQLGQKFNEAFIAPSKVYVENFKNLNIEDGENVAGFCNLFPTYLHKNSDDVTDAQVVFFNSENRDWNKINSISDMNFAKKFSATSHFLNDFIHEFSHASHEENLLNNVDPYVLLEKISQFENQQKQIEFINKNGKLLSKEICNYAVMSPLEAIACDVPKRITNCLDKDLNLVKNPFEKTFYSSNMFEDIPENKKTEVDKLLSKFWNGNF